MFQEVSAGSRISQGRFMGYHDILWGFLGIVGASRGLEAFKVVSGSIQGFEGGSRCYLDVPKAFQGSQRRFSGLEGPGAF